MNLITTTWVSEFAIMRLQQSTSDNSMVCTILRRTRRKKLKKLQFPLHSSERSLWRANYPRVMKSREKRWAGSERTEKRSRSLWSLVRKGKKKAYFTRKDGQRGEGSFFFLFLNSRKWKSAVKMRIYSIIFRVDVVFGEKTHGKLDWEVHMFFSGALECWTCWWFFLDIWGFCRCLASMPMGILAHIPMWLLWLFFKLFYFMNFISASLSCCSFIDDMCPFSICSVLHRETSSSCVRWWWWYVAQKDGLWWVQMLARSLCSSHQLVIDKFLLLLCGKLTRVTLAQCRTWNETE